jgi:hypothetical protein
VRSSMPAVRTGRRTPTQPGIAAKPGPGTGVTAGRAVRAAPEEPSGVEALRASWERHIARILMWAVEQVVERLTPALLPPTTLNVPTTRQPASQRPRALVCASRPVSEVSFASVRAVLPRTFGALGRSGSGCATADQGRAVNRCRVNRQPAASIRSSRRRRRQWAGGTRRTNRRRKRAAQRKGGARRS